jgi:hypothetical protein
MKLQMQFQEILSGSCEDRREGVQSIRKETTYILNIPSSGTYDERLEEQNFIGSFERVEPGRFDPDA